MKIKAIDLYNELKECSESELKKLSIVIETGRDSTYSILGRSEYATLIERYPSQIRIIHKNKKKSERIDAIAENL